MLSIEGGFPRGLHNFVNDLKQQFTIEMVATRCKPTFQHQYALSRLKSDGYGIAVCSNSIRNSVRMMMEKAGLDEYLNFYLSNQDVNKGKPDPEMYSKAIEKFQLQPDECLILEDNENGIKAALASGAHLLKVETVLDVNYFNIVQRIKEIEEDA
jgi:HAD superfamily hydrolase (TIGR01509 family)